MHLEMQMRIGPLRVARVTNGAKCIAGAHAAVQPYRFRSVRKVVASPVVSRKVHDVAAAGVLAALRDAAVDGDDRRAARRLNVHALVPAAVRLQYSEVVAVVVRSGDGEDTKRHDTDSSMS